MMNANELTSAIFHDFRELYDYTNITEGRVGFIPLVDVVFDKHISFNEYGRKISIGQMVGLADTYDNFYKYIMTNKELILFKLL
ncbi:hypothetical protein KAU11_09665 [Candidatus Babeliales bacterium]|nr:hypothetical protein [Candidatus Babeliales bacterium]